MKKYKKEYFGDLRLEFEYADQYSSKAIDILRNSNSRKKQSSVKDIIYAPYILAEQVKAIKTGKYKPVKSISKVKCKNKDYYWESIGKKSIKNDEQ